MEQVTGVSLLSRKECALFTRVCACEPLIHPGCPSRFLRFDIEFLNA